MRVKDILRGSLVEHTLYPESVAHLLHQDLAYLWVLSTTPEFRPEHWRFRVEGWRRLLGLYLLGKLRVRQTPILMPFAERTKPLGITAVEELWLDEPERRVGVLSPVILVRPLPDATPESLASLPDPAAQPGPLLYFAALLEQALERLRSAAGRRPIHDELYRAVAEARAAWQARAGQAAPARAYRPTEVRRRLFRYIDFAAEHPDAADDVSIPVWASGSISLYVPRCQTCRALLTRNEAPVEVTGDYVTLACPSGHSNDIPLDRLLLWRRNPRELIAWTDRTEMAPGEDQLFPPPVEVSGDMVKFTWQPADVDLETERRYLTLRFPNKAIRAASFVNDVFYEQLAVPDTSPAQFTGLPVRAAWRDAWIGVADRITGADNVLYARVTLRGVPFAFHRTYVKSRLRLVPELAVGIYPKPMHADWRLYRAFLTGSTAEWHLSAGGVAGPIAAAVDTTEWPDFVSLEHSDGLAGASWRPAPADETARTTRAGVALSLGIDFGTTNTVVYFQGERGGRLSTQENALRLEDFERLAHWLHPPSPDASRRGWFLPPAPSAGQDRSLIPSALWDCGRMRFGSIRWSPQAPDESCETVYGFKWDEALQDLSSYRERYLQELLRMGLPAVLDRLGVRGGKPFLRLGFSYPLAFNYGQREDYRTMLHSLRTWLAAEAGLDSDIFTINESMASLRALGTFRPDDVFLIADMGGHTLDVALYTHQSEAEQVREEGIHQIGSLDFGGEAFLAGVLQAQNPKTSRREMGAAYWRLRDRLSNPAERGAFARDQAFLGRMDRFHILALEFLRTMAEAWLKDKPETARVDILLAGNGWRLRELSRPDGDPRVVFGQYFEDRVAAFSKPGVRHMLRRLEGIEHTKHWVAVGALNVAIHSSRRELEESPFLAKLPAGRNLTVGPRRTEWWENEGEGGKPLGMPKEVAKASQIDVEYTSGPEAPPAWSQFLDVAIQPPRRYPREEELRDRLILEIADTRLLKGPLTLIVEGHWKEELCR